MCPKLNKKESNLKLNIFVNCIDAINNTKCTILVCWLSIPILKNELRVITAMLVLPAMFKAALATYHHSTFYLIISRPTLSKSKWATRHFYFNQRVAHLLFEPTHQQNSTTKQQQYSNSIRQKTKNKKSRLTAAYFFFLESMRNSTRK